MNTFFAMFGKISATLILLTLVAFGAYTIGISRSTALLPPQSNKLVKQSTPTEEPYAPTSTPTQTTQHITAGLNFAGGISFPAYTIDIPASWTVSHTNTNGESPTDTLIASSHDYQIKIFQGATGGSVCLYPSDPDQEGPHSRYTTFTEFTDKTGNTFRRGDSSSSYNPSISKFAICMRKKGATLFGEPTGFGHISYTGPQTPDPLVLSLMDQTIATIMTK